MKTKTNRSQKGAAEKLPAEPTITLRLPLGLKHAQLLRACAAFEAQTPEEYALDALRGYLWCSAEAIGLELKQAG